MGTLSTKHSITNILNILELCECSSYLGSIKAHCDRHHLIYDNKYKVRNNCSKGIGTCELSGNLYNCSHFIKILGKLK